MPHDSGPTMTDVFARRLLALLVLLLAVGTQMPGAWRAGAESAVHAPFALSSWAHFVLFAGLGAVAFARPLAWPGARVVLAALGLALVSEGLQFFAIDRQPDLLDVGIDMGGVLAGMVLARGVAWLAAGRGERC